MDTQQLVRNQLDALLKAIEFMTGINYEQRIEELEKQNTMLVKALDNIEWVTTTARNYPICPWCAGSKTGGHYDDCQRQQALAECQTCQKGLGK